MKRTIPDELLIELADASRGTKFRMFVDDAVSRHFRSTHYIASELVADCVTLNLLLNDDITPHSADEIIRCMHRTNRAFYTTVEKAFLPVEDRFYAHAKEICGDVDSLKMLDLRTVNLIVYVISLDLKDNKNIIKSEIFSRVYTLLELREKPMPHY